MNLSIVGFDSAWTDNPKAPGAVCAILIDADGATRFIEPRLASFAQALDFIADIRSRAALCIVALDQPTIVPNLSGSRPVDKVAASLISWIGGGVQPANRSKRGMFDDDAPVWRFKAALGAIEDPEAARTATSGLHIIEVFPALALASLDTSFCSRLGGPRYNPGRRRTFKIEDWSRVVEVAKSYGQDAGIEDLVDWTNSVAANQTPKKADQDRLDAAICSLVGYHWRVRPRSESIMIGDLNTGYMISPISLLASGRLEAAARKRAVLVDGHFL